MSLKNSTTCTDSNMSAACWEDRSQLLGRDPELWDDEDAFSYHYDEEEREDDEGCCAAGCMECLGLSWSDFM